MNPMNWMKAVGIPDECITNKSSCEEKGRKFTIIPVKGEIIRCIKVDNCWLNQDQKKVDYLLWGRALSGKQILILVELKGGDYGKALEQIYSTLQMLCRYSDMNMVHKVSSEREPVHSPTMEQSVQAYVVLSTGKEASKRMSKQGRKIPQHFHKIESIRKKFRVRVYPKTDQVIIKGLESLCQS